jgi:hypothetical protein
VPQDECDDDDDDDDDDDTKMRGEALAVDEREVFKEIDDRMPPLSEPAPAAAGAAFKNSIHETEKKQYALVPKNSIQDEDAALIEQAMDTLTQYRMRQQRMLSTAQDLTQAQEKTRDGANHTRDAFKVTELYVHRILADAKLTSADVVKTKAEVLATRATVRSLR